jgi:hypothetical protein
MNALTTLALCLVALLGCGSDLPSRYVLERDAGEFTYRRYQHVLDVELVVPGNPATGYTATYLRRDRGRGVGIATAFVTVYDHPKSLAAEARERLAALSRYRLSAIELGGGNAWLLDGGENERWAMWVSGRYLIKLGAPAGEGFPEALADAYMDVYPSDLDEHGYAEKDAPSAGPSRHEQAEDAAAEPPVPRSLREHAPK